MPKEKGKRRKTLERMVEAIWEDPMFRRKNVWR